MSSQFSGEKCVLSPESCWFYSWMTYFSTCVYHNLLFSFYHRRPTIFEKNFIRDLFVWCRVSSTVTRTPVLWLDKTDATSTRLFGAITTFVGVLIKQLFIYKFWWSFYPDNIFLVDLYHETLGPGVNVESYPFPFGIKFSLVSMRKPIFLGARDQASIPGWTVYVFKNLWKFCCLQMKILREIHLFFSIV